MGASARVARSLVEHADAAMRTAGWTRADEILLRTS